MILLHPIINIKRMNITVSNHHILNKIITLIAKSLFLEKITFEKIYIFIYLYIQHFLL